jgi:hypothetical protein
VISKLAPFEGLFPGFELFTNYPHRSVSCHICLLLKWTHSQMGFPYPLTRGSPAPGTTTWGGKQALIHQSTNGTKCTLTSNVT